MAAESTVRFVGIVDRAGEDESAVWIFPEFCPGLKRIDEFSHLFILYWMHRRDDEANRRTLLVFPKRHDVQVETGVFACRSPSRPNPIGLCVVELKRVKNCTLIVKGLDAEEGSPIVDIKPYLPRGDCVPDARVPQWTSRGPPT